ncbi:MAG: cell wall hydrolase [Novosphingobium sp.]
MISILAIGIALSASDINFAQTPTPDAGLEAVTVENHESAPTVSPAAEQPAAGAIADAAPETGEPSPDGLAVSDKDAECLAKIVHHESANQHERVQLAVANVVLNRLKSSSSAFPDSICAIALQRGQFFNVHAYRPHRDPRWAFSQEIASRAIAGEGNSFAPGALFFHTKGAVSQISRKRPRVARLGGMDFYR